MSHRESLAQIIEAGKRVIDDPTHLADFGAALTSGESHQIQAVLECPDVITLSSLWLNYGHCLVKNWKKFVDSFIFDCLKFIKNSNRKINVNIHIYCFIIKVHHNNNNN